MFRSIGFRILLGAVLVVPPAFAGPTNLTSEQREALERAREEGDNFEWAVLTKTVRGEPRTVVIMGEGFFVLPDDTAIARRVIDQFERFAVDPTGPYDDRPTPQHEPIDTEPMNLTARGARTRSVENVEQLHRWGIPDYAEASVLVGTGAAALLSIGYLTERTRGLAFNPQRDAVATGVIATAVLLYAAKGLCPTCFPLGQSRASSMAKFIDRWVKERGSEGPLVVVVKKGYVDEVRRVLTRRYSFNGGVS